MKIRIDTILPEGLHLDCNIPAEEIDQDNLDFRLISAIRFDGSLDPLNSGFMLNGTFSTQIEAQCARCLKTFRSPVSSAFKLFFTQSLPDTDPDYESETADHADCECVDDVIDLTNLLREQLILQVPLKVVCDENCLGLCQQCGKNLNEGCCNCDTTAIDPRLLKLKQLFENK